MATQKPGIDLTFPFLKGNYYIIQGGWNIETNSHFSNGEEFGDPGVNYALDIVKLNKFGNYSKNLSPNPLAFEQYEIFGDTIYSPCNGVVYDLENDKYDHGFLSSISEAKDKGNHIRIFTNNNMIVLGHLKQGSVMVNKGDTVSVGQALATVGHSGYTNFPHLHMHVYSKRTVINEKGESSRPNVPIPMYFSNDFLIRNDQITLK